MCKYYFLIYTYIFIYTLSVCRSVCVFVKQNILSQPFHYIFTHILKMNGTRWNRTLILKVIIDDPNGSNHLVSHFLLCIVRSVGRSLFRFYLYFVTWKSKWKCSPSALHQMSALVSLSSGQCSEQCYGHGHISVAFFFFLHVCVRMNIVRIYTGDQRTQNDNSTQTQRN